MVASPRISHRLSYGISSTACGKSKDTVVRNKMPNPVWMHTRHCRSILFCPPEVLCTVCVRGDGFLIVDYPLWQLRGMLDKFPAQEENHVDFNPSRRGLQSNMPCPYSSEVRTRCKKPGVKRILVWEESWRGPYMMFGRSIRHILEAITVHTSTVQPAARTVYRSKLKALFELFLSALMWRQR